MQDFSRSYSTPVARRVGFALLVVALAITAVGAGVGAGSGGVGPEAEPGAIGLASAQAQPSNGTGSGIGTNSSSPAPGKAIPVSCGEVRENPTSEGPNYRVVRGTCAIELSNGEVLSNVWFKAQGQKVDIWARGSGWTIRNIAVTGHGASENPPLNLRVSARDGVGLVSNVWVSKSDSNALFVHPSHAGTIRFQGVTFYNIAEDGAYASRPGNPPSLTDGDPKIEGNEGIVGFSQAYVKHVGFGPEAGYGLRLGSDGSYIVNSTIINTGGPAVANTFASGQNPKRHSRAFAGVLLRNVDIIQSEKGGSGLRLNNHQGGVKPQREWTSRTTLQNVDIAASDPIQRNKAGGKAPIIRGEYGTNANPSPPPGAPRSPQLAASGVGGGTGTIGGPVGTGTGVGFFPLTEVVTVVGLLVMALLAVIVLGAFGVVYLLEHKSGAMSLFVVLLVLGAIVGGAVGPALAQPAPTPNGTNGTNATNSSSPSANTTGPDTPVPVQTLAPNDSQATSANSSNGSNTTNASGPTLGGGNGSGNDSSGLGLGVPSTDEIVGDLVNATIGKFTGMLTDALGSIFMLPWKFITMRFAPFGGASGGGAEGPLAVWDRPDAPLFGQLYDLAMGSMLRIAFLLFAAFFVIDWFANFSKHPGADGPVDRLMLRAADCLHLLFSWPIAWGHFLLASFLAALLMPSQETIAGTVNEGLGNVVGLVSAGGAVVVLPFLLAIILWLLLKHAGAFVYLVIGLATYPVLVGASVPDHWLLGRLGNFAENTRQKYVVAAWWPVPTAAVLGVGYTIDNALLELLTAGDLLNDAAGGAIVYPALWLAALYAPIKVFSDGTPPLLRRRSRSRAGGRPSGGGGSGSPLSRGGTAAVTGGAAGALAGGAGSVAGSGASAASSAGGAVSSAGAGASGEFSRLASGSPSARTLAGDGGSMSVDNMQAATGASAGGAGGGSGGGSNTIGGSFGPPAGGADGSAGSAGSSAGHSAFTGQADAGTSGSDGFGGASGFSGTTGAQQSASGLNEAEGITEVSQSTFDTAQRYEPLVHQENAGFQRVDPPKDAKWLSEKGGFDRLNQAYGEPVRLRGENDGQLYDLSDAADSGPSFDHRGNDADTIRDF